MRKNGFGKGVGSVYEDRGPLVVARRSEFPALQCIVILQHTLPVFVPC